MAAIPICSAYATWPASAAVVAPAHQRQRRETILALQLLFALHGAVPLVLKTDNGSPFIAEDSLAFLAQCGVLSLFSRRACRK